MSHLSDWVDITSEANMQMLGSLVGGKIAGCGRYDNLRDTSELLQRLESAIVDIPSKFARPLVLELSGVGVGTPLTVNKSLLADLVDALRLDPQTPVHLKYRFGGLFLFLLVSDAASFAVKTSLASVAVNIPDKTVWAARLGKFTLANQVWGQSHLNGRITTLQKALKVPYLTTYTLVDARDFHEDLVDLPC